MEKVDTYAKIIWNYMLMHHSLKPMDAIFAMGSNDTRVAERAAELYGNGYADYVICAGGNGKVSDFLKPEAEVFTDVLIARNVPTERIIIENKSTNTGENVIFVKKLLEEKHLNLKSFILVQKPYMERRAFATFCKQWPEADCVVTSPQLSYERYSIDETFKNRFINIMVGDLQRIKEYPAKGFQIFQEIPGGVWNAYEKLVDLGYTKHVLKT